MVEFPDKNIYLYSEGIDFRKGIKSLSNFITINCYSLLENSLKVDLDIIFNKKLNYLHILLIKIHNDKHVRNI